MCLLLHAHVQGVIGVSVLSVCCLSMTFKTVQYPDFRAAQLVTVFFAAKSDTNRSLFFVCHTYDNVDHTYQFHPLLLTLAMGYGIYIPWVFIICSAELQLNKHNSYTSGLCWCLVLDIFAVSPISCLLFTFFSFLSTTSGKWAPISGCKN